MLSLAMVQHNCTPQNIWYVGDRPKDEEAARRARVQFQWAENWIKKHQAAVAPLIPL
ncbi:MAG: HAD family hydrolase [Nodosilinea sp. WJT8-NPBG4]|jgi:D-glycero-D-manno-heptose 1,7-bisphosphate phosphatase|nr:HAD family hydrolase [Nodosilinea sp. WJT8-NPBG4]